MFAISITILLQVTTIYYLLGVCISIDQAVYYLSIVKIRLYFMSTFAQQFQLCYFLNNLVKLAAIRLMSIPIRNFQCNNEQSNNINKCNLTLIACGSYNPVTYMHLRMFELAKDYLKEHYPAVTVKSGIISPVCDSYGKAGLVSSHHRKAMCQLGVSDSSWIKVGCWEMKQPQWTPTVKVLEHFEDLALANDSTSKVMLLCGSDVLESFTIKDLWLKNDIHKLIEHFGLIVIGRSTSDTSKVINQSPFLSQFNGQIHIVNELFTNSISSTAVRKAVRESKSIKYLIPDPVIDYIKQNELYIGEIPPGADELAPFKLNRKIHTNACNE